MRLPDLATLWWGKIPAAVSRVSSGLALALSDGIHVAAWPYVAEFGPPACLLLGLLAGWTHPGFGEVWTQSLPFMALAMPPAIRATIVSRLENEMARYSAVIGDASNPTRGLEVITNDPRAVPFFQDLLTKYGIPGKVVVQP